jgi:hypothetical protein
MRKFCAVVAVSLACTTLAYSNVGIQWMKWKEAKALAAATGKPIVVYATVNEEGGGC